MNNQTITFPTFTGKRVLMMPFIQGDIDSLPDDIRNTYGDIVKDLYLQKGELGYITIDESEVKANNAQRAYESTNGRSIHTEATRYTETLLCWGGLGWGMMPDVQLEPTTEVLVASNVSGSTAYWTEDILPENVTRDGMVKDIEKYSLESAKTLQAGEVVRMSVLTPHESLPVKEDVKRQFIRVVGKGIAGMLPNYTPNPLMH